MFLVGVPGAYLTYRQVAPGEADPQAPFFAMFVAMAFLGLFGFMVIQSLVALGRGLWRALAGSTGPAVEDQIRTKVVGVTHRNGDGSDRQVIIARYCRAGTPLRLVREPRNSHDPNAVAVFVGKRQIGYISASLASDVARMLDAGATAEAVVTAVTGGGRGENHGVNIQIDLS